MGRKRQPPKAAMHTCHPGGPSLDTPASSDTRKFSAPPGHLDRGGDEPMAEGRTKSEKGRAMAKESGRTSPGEFLRQVRSEASKVVWPTRQETVRMAILVGILTLILSLFFLGVDSLFGAVVRWLLSLA